MLSISKPEKNRIDIEVDGQVSKVEMQGALNSILELSADLDQVKVMYSIRNLAFPELGAIAVELQSLPRLYSLKDKFKHIAVLTDSTILESIAKFEDKIFKTMEIRTFNLEQREEAEQWLRTVDSDDANTARQND